MLFSFGLALGIIYPILSGSNVICKLLFINNLKHRGWSSFLLPAYLADRLAHIYNMFNSSPPQAEIPRASSLLEHVPQLCVLSYAYNLIFCTEEETVIFWSPPPPPKKKIKSCAPVKHLMVAKHWIDLLRKTGYFTSKDWSLKNK